jgi:hypothetical protein
MVHGRINHGEQFLAEEHRRTPTSYYCESPASAARCSACRRSGR